MNEKQNAGRCGDASGGGSASWRRRDFIRLSAVGAAAIFSSQLPAMAGPFTAEDFERLVPADKKLDPAWVKALFARGTPAVLHGDELAFVGLPIGGITCGQLYLGGDGRLWQWDIFNQTPWTDDAHYAKPPKPSSPLEQGFALKIGDTARPLDRTGFSDVSFRGEYPFGIVEYRDPASPVAVTLEAFSPFIPLNVEDSSLPATVLRFTVRNTSSRPLDATLIGSLQNAVCHLSRPAAGRRRNAIVNAAEMAWLDCSVEPADEWPLTDLHDFGTMGLALLGTAAEHTGGVGARSVTEKLTGEIGRALHLAPGASATVTFVLAWYFPNLHHDRYKRVVGRHYAARFDSARTVADYVAKNFERLERETRLWRDTWYDSTLPFWLLDRTMLNTSILATSTSLRFADGRFWGWEGVGSCAGTCTHVWGYAQAVGRLFPELERDLRERVDYGLAFDASGRIGFRGDLTTAEGLDGWAVDGQAMIILRTLREHQCSPNDQFLRRVWPHAKRALDALIARDPDADGILDGPQHNTLDSAWFGHIAWLSGLYLAALQAGAAMADEMRDADYAKGVRAIAARGSEKFVRELFDGDYFINRPDPAHLDAINSGTGCHIDQLLGQSWAWQVGLGRLLPEKETRTALRALWRHNFSPDVGPYRAAHQPGRWFALPGEAGLLMTTFPRTDWDYAKASGDKTKESIAGYFNECMNGFEYQVAGHMIREGLVLEGLAITRAVHDRYAPLRRNPWNEVECGDHYARSMASYGVFLATGGFEYHGPRGHLGFSPRLTPENFRTAFTAAEGWGTFAQQAAGSAWTASVEIKWGRLRLKTLSLDAPVGNVIAHVAKKEVRITASSVGGRTTLSFHEDLNLGAGEALVLSVA
jgi:uncharacterized protein (DUF608 family)